MSSEFPTEAQVVAYLNAHRDFFEHHLDLLAELSVPHASGAAVSLVERQVSVLRERNAAEHERLQQLVEVARENDVLFDKVRSLILTLLEARNIAEITVALEHELKTHFHSEFVSFLLFDAKGIVGAAQNVALADAQAHVPTLVKGRQVVAGQLRHEELTFLFGHNGEQVKSCVVVPLQRERLFGLLAIGSSDAGHFHTSMDTLFVSFIGEALARLLEPLLKPQTTRQRAK